MKRWASSKINLYACIVVVAFLVLLFTLPRKTLQSMRSDILSKADALSAAVLADDWPSARSASEAIKARFLQDKQRLKLFLDHEDLDSLEAAIRSVEALTAVEDEPQLLLELESIKNVATYITEIETFTFFNLF